MASNQAERLAVLIDADNAEASVLHEIFVEISKHGNATVRRAYGDWTTGQLASWKQNLHRFAIQPMQQFAYTRGKNATDSALIIDAMDILHAKHIDGFCIVSSDSDFTRLATRIREAGMVVYGFGQRRTPEAFVKACNQFIFTEILQPESSTGTRPPTASKPPASAHPQNTAPPQPSGAGRKRAGSARQSAPVGGPGTGTLKPHPKPGREERPSALGPSAAANHSARAPVAGGVGSDALALHGNAAERQPHAAASHSSPERAPEPPSKAPGIAPLSANELFATEEPEPNPESLVRKAVESTAQEDGWASLSVVGSFLRRISPSFDSRNFGYKQLGALMKQQDYLEVKEVSSDPKASHVGFYVRLKGTEKAPAESRLGPH